MQIPEEISPSVAKALARLSIGDLTCAEMIGYLTSKGRKSTGFSEEIAKKTVALLETEGFLDDKRYLKLLVRRLDEKKYGPRKIREILVAHHFSPRYVEAALSRDVDYESRALALLERAGKRGADLRDPKEKKRTVDFLVRKGYDYETAFYAVRTIADDETFSE